MWGIGIATAPVHTLRTTTAQAATRRRQKMAGRPRIEGLTVVKGMVEAVSLIVVPYLPFGSTSGNS